AEYGVAHFCVRRKKTADAVAHCSTVERNREHEIECAADQIAQIAGESPLRFDRHEREAWLAVDEPHFDICLDAVLELLQEEWRSIAQRAQMLSHLAVLLGRRIGLWNPRFVVMPGVGFGDLRG